jgi:hypothetical protein
MPGYARASAARQAGCALAACAVVLWLFACESPPQAPVTDLAPEQDRVFVRRSKLDLLAVISSGDNWSGVIGDYVLAVRRLADRLLEPADGRPVRDFHLGVTTSKIDMVEICSDKPEVVANDGSLIKPTDPNRPHESEYPSSLPWPPPWPYLNGDLAGQLNVAGLWANYVWQAQRMTEREGWCAVTQYLQSAALAVDGRNTGFVRDDSLLVILILADREDCSTQRPSFWADRDEWGKLYWDPNARCYYPPAGALYPIDHYKDVFGKSHPAGTTLVVVVGLQGVPQFESQWDGSKFAMPDCEGQLRPSLRLPAFVSAANQAGDPALGARMIEACPIALGYETGIPELADTILGLMER